MQLQEAQCVELSRKISSNPLLYRHPHMRMEFLTFRTDLNGSHMLPWPSSQRPARQGSFGIDSFRFFCRVSTSETGLLVHLECIQKSMDPALELTPHFIQYIYHTGRWLCSFGEDTTMPGEADMFFDHAQRC